MRTLVTIIKNLLDCICRFFHEFFLVRGGGSNPPDAINSENLVLIFDDKVDIFIFFQLLQNLYSLALIFAMNLSSFLLFRFQLFHQLLKSCWFLWIVVILLMWLPSLGLPFCKFSKCLAVSSFLDMSACFTSII